MVAAAAAAAVVAADMDSDDKTTVEMFRSSQMQYSFKIYRKILHVKKSLMLFQQLGQLK